MNKEQDKYVEQLKQRISLLEGCIIVQPKKKPTSLVERIKRRISLLENSIIKPGQL